MSFEEARPTSKPKKEIYSIAEKFYEYYNLKPAFNIFELANNLGAEIISQDIDEFAQSQDGSIKVEEKGKFKIYISKYTGPLRDRFTIAHELGHYVLHSDYGKKKIKAARSGSNQVEWEANWFAAGLLMPTRIFGKYYKKLKKLKNRDIKPENILAGKFLVSLSATNIRIETLTKEKF